MAIRVFRKAAIAASAALLLGGIATPAFADSAPNGSSEITEYPGISDSVVADLNAGFDRVGVAGAARAGLFAKWAAGEQFDSFTDAAPVSIETFRVGITDFTRDVYADGSVSVTSVERPTVPSNASGGISPQIAGISGCKYLLSTGVASYSNCKISKDSAVLYMSFRANYQRWSRGSGAQLANSWDWDLQSSGASCAKTSLAGVTSTKVQMRASCNFPAGVGSSNPYLLLSVSSSSAKVTSNY
ncbi:hypothetical protein LK09_14290 [Microbacterium mangrovi]|uniref:Secreted protein n=1 Tax=Microbacterium mangrovi TaxID=1348253 RepID=A0A0B2A0I4_9MICO|nr:hypothetical protein [Microbacterium mangrovi]KHK96526.1 hypothetical protein LK09_14290 [Microbacterium mangrovi]